MERLAAFSRCGSQANVLLETSPLPPWCRHALFRALGYIAKADGRVLETDIRFAESLMAALKLSPGQRRKAISDFKQGKGTSQPGPRHRFLFRMTTRLWPGPALTTALCLCHGAQITGRPSKARRYRCEDAIDQIGLPVSVSDDIFHYYAGKVWLQTASSIDKPATYDQACEILGVTRRDSLQVIKRSYRKKISACHPDKLAQQNLSPAEQANAKNLLLRYQQAWELIRQRHRQL